MKVLNEYPSDFYVPDKLHCCFTGKFQTSFDLRQVAAEIAGSILTSNLLSKFMRRKNAPSSDKFHFHQNLK